MKTNHKFSLIGFVFLSYCFAGSALAFEAKNLPETPIENDFVVSPARTEIVMKPGGKITKYITVLNRLGEDYNFTVSTEDFSPEQESGNPVLNEDGAAGGVFSLKNYVKPEVKSFFLKQGSRATLAVTIAVPKGASPGGRYAAVLISASPRSIGDSSTTLVSRIGSLLLVKIDGAVEENGQLTNFVFKDKQFWVSYKNDGNVHLDPYGIIEIKDEAGNLVETVQIDPWVILPGSARSRPLVLSGELSNGKYVATIRLNRGYKDIIDIKEISFRLGPIPVVAGVAEANIDINVWYLLFILVFGAVALFVVRFMRKK